MYTLITSALNAVVRLFTNGGEKGLPDSEVETPSSGILTRSLSSPSEETAASSGERQSDLSRWTVTEVQESPFLKVGRLFIEGDVMVIRSDLNASGFFIPLNDVASVLEGGTAQVFFYATNQPVGTVKLSASGKAVNVWIEPVLYTVPRARVVDILEGRARKAAVFAGREVMEG